MYYSTSEIENRYQQGAAPPETRQNSGTFDICRIFVMINRGACRQCGSVIPKRSLEQLQREYCRWFRNKIISTLLKGTDACRLNLHHYSRVIATNNAADRSVPLWRSCCSGSPSLLPCMPRNRSKSLFPVSRVML